MRHEPVWRRLGPVIEAGEAASCAIIELEVLYSVRNADDHRRIRRRRASAYERVPIDDVVFDRAIEVQGLLATKGHHRLPIPDLLIAAAAEHAKLTVLHYDGDFDRISQVTGQMCEWVVPNGSVP